MEQVRLCAVVHGELAWLFLEPDTGLDHCPRILLSRFRARTSVIEYTLAETSSDENYRVTMVDLD